MLTPCTSTQRKLENEQRKSKFLYQAVELPTSDSSIFAENEGLVQIKVIMTNHDFGPDYTLH